MNGTTRTQPRPARRPRATWRAFEPRHARQVDAQLQERRTPCCPCCGDPLAAHPTTRMSRYLPLDATGYDLECRGCRRFRCVVRHTLRSLRLVRMRRLVAAVRASGEPARSASHEDVAA